MEKQIHQGRNIKRFREMLGIKQEAMAMALGEDWNQRKISLLEQKPEIEPALLKEVAGFLRVPVESILRFDEETALQLITELGQPAREARLVPTVSWEPDRAFDKILSLYEALLKAEREKSYWIERCMQYRSDYEKPVSAGRFQVEEAMVPYLWNRQGGSPVQPLQN
ncbi:MAG TPA: helix-turn-helix transcriptional regulator [Flavihumibacter sp.]